MARVHLYCRVSSVGQQENTSLSDQETRGRAFIASQGWEEPIVYREVASGRSMDRPAMQQLRTSLETGDRVIVAKLDRLSRSIVTGYPLIEEWMRSDISLHSVCEPIETGSAMGRSMLRMVLCFAEGERELIAERMASGKARKAESGGFVGSRVPFGYRAGRPGDPELVPDPRTADVVRELFRRYSSGRYGVRRLKRLTGCPLGEATISELLANPVYSGRTRFKGSVVPGQHEALVSEWLFARAQGVRRQRGRSAA